MYIKNVGPINRIERTAKLLGVSGSVVERNKLASNLNKRFNVVIRESLAKRVQEGKPAYVTAVEIEKHIEKLADGVRFFLDRNKDDSLGAALVHEQLQGKINSIYAHTVELPFAKRGKTETLSENKLYLLSHELRHFFDAVTQPRFLAKENSFQRLKNQKAHWNFYVAKIYLDQDNEKYQDKIIPKLKSQINAHFDKHKTPQSDKIEALQYWRYQLKYELNASKDEVFYPLHDEYKIFKDSIKNDEKLKISISDADLKFDSEGFATKKEKMNALLGYKKRDYDYKYREKYSESYYFEEKIKLIEDLLAENIAKFRTKHKQTLINKGID